LGQGPKTLRPEKNIFLFFPDERAANGERLVIETD